MRRLVRANREIAYWQTQFRLLEDWDIDFVTEAEFKDCCGFNPPLKHGTIYDTSYARMPKDYIFHEMLHMAMAAIRRKKKSKDKKEAEEILVQDLCRVAQL